MSPVTSATIRQAAMAGYAAWTGSVVTKRRKRKDGSLVSYRTTDRPGHARDSRPTRTGHLRTSPGPGRGPVEHLHPPSRRPDVLRPLPRRQGGCPRRWATQPTTGPRISGMRHARRTEADKLLHGTDSRGIKHVSSKLTEAQVLQIRYTYRQGGTTYRGLWERSTG